MKTTLTVIAVAASIILGSCSKDDSVKLTDKKTENSSTNIPQLTISPEDAKGFIGKWEAKKFSYTTPGGEKHEFEFSFLKRNCAVDIIEFKASGEAILNEQNPDTKGKCVDQITKGSFSKTEIYFGTQKREIISLSEDFKKLILKYEMNNPSFGKAIIEVEYLKK